jgi:hypothetical protein
MSIAMEKMIFLDAKERKMAFRGVDMDVRIRRVFNFVNVDFFEDIKQVLGFRFIQSLYCFHVNSDLASMYMTWLLHDHKEKVAFFLSMRKLVKEI